MTNQISDESLNIGQTTRTFKVISGIQTETDKDQRIVTFIEICWHILGPQEIFFYNFG
jgi:hypothetical protein